MFCPKCGSEEVSDANQMAESLGIPNDSGKQWMCGKCSHFFDAEATHWYDGEDFAELSVSQLADVIFEDWGDTMSPHAYPYITAMMDLESIHDTVGHDSGESIISYFLLHAKSWNSDIAKRVKQELNSRLNEKGTKKIKIISIDKIEIGKTDMATYDRSESYIHIFKCRSDDCRLEFAVLSWREKWPEEHEPYCPECGEQDAICLRSRFVKRKIWEIVSDPSLGAKKPQG